MSGTVSCDYCETGGDERSTQDTGRPCQGQREVGGHGQRAGKWKGNSNLTK